MGVAVSVAVGGTGEGVMAGVSDGMARVGVAVSVAVGGTVGVADGAAGVPVGGPGVGVGGHEGP